MSVNGALVKDKMRGFKGECAHFSFKKCPIYTHDDASAKFGTNSQETDNSVVDPCRLLSSLFLFGRFGLVWIDFSPPPGFTSPVITGLSELSGEPRFRNVNL